VSVLVFFSYWALRQLEFSTWCTIVDGDGYAPLASS